MDANRPLGYDPATTWARHCSECGAIDDSERWPTHDEAEADGVSERPWSCPRCGSERFAVKPVATLGGG